MIKGINKAGGGSNRPREINADTATVVEAWVKWLAHYPIDHFSSLSFRNVATEERADKARDRWVRRLERDNGGRVDWVSVFEPGDLHGRYHLHVLTLNTASLTCRLMATCWHEGTSRIRQYRRERGALFYTLIRMRFDAVTYDVSAKLGQCRLPF